MNLIGKVYAATITGPPTNITSIGQIITNVLTVVYPLVGVALFAYFVFGGFMYLSSAGDRDKVKKGTDTMLNAAIGTGIIVFAYVLTKIVGGILGFDFTIFG